MFIEIEDEGENGFNYCRVFKNGNRDACVPIKQMSIANSYSYSHNLSKETSRQLVLDMQPVVEAV